MKLGRISRIVQLLTILQSDHNHSADHLAKLVGVSRRTIFRDLNELEAIGVPCRFDPKTGGYTIDPEFFLQPVDFNLQEALSLLMLVQKASGHLPMPFKNSIILAGLKIENNLPANIRRYCNMTLNNVSIRPDSHAPMDLLDATFAQLQMAARKRRNIRLKYDSLYEGETITTTLSCYHVSYRGRAWYVIGHSKLHDSIRTFKLNRIKQLTVLKTCFARDRAFDVTDYFGNAWAMIPEGKMYLVRLRFSAKVAKNVSEVQWHRSQKMTFSDDGSLLAEFRVDGLGEITWWILGYGDQVQVLSPAPLRKKLVKVAQKMVDLNKIT